MMTRPTIVRGFYTKNVAGGRRTYKPIRNFIRYLTLGRLAEQSAQSQPRGLWLDHASKLQSQQQVERWAKQKVHLLQYDYAYQLLLSTSKGELDSADFNTALQAGVPISGVHEWRMMPHTDTRNQHAHAILFRREQLNKQDYLAWQQAMQQALDKQQMQRLLEREQSARQQKQQAAEPQPAQQIRSQGIEL